MSLRIGALGTSFAMPYVGSASVSPLSNTGAASETGTIQNSGESTIKAPGRKSSPAECKTCAERKYVDGSDESDVSCQTPTHFSPEQAASAVRAHEGQHVANAYQKAGAKNGTVLQASVRIKTAICPECGRSYVAGGVTATKIKYSNEENPYQKARKKADAGALAGMNFDAAV